MRSSSSMTTARPTNKTWPLRFLQMQGAVYRLLDLPKTQFRDWVVRSETTIRDLDSAPEATISHYGHRYFHPYTATEYPDIMVQMSLLSAISNFADWKGEHVALTDEIRAGLGKFHDTKLKTMRRYLQRRQGQRQERSR